MKIVHQSLLLVCTAFLFSITLWYVLIALQQNLYSSDFRVFYSSGYILRTQPEKLYDSNIQQQTQLRFFPQTSAHFFRLSFVNPPFFALFFLPLTFLPPFTAYFSLLIGNAALYISLILILIHYLNIPRQRIPLVFAYSLSFLPFYVTLINTQSSILTLGVFILSIWMLQRKQSTSAGITLSLLLYKPQLALFGLFFILLQKNWNALKGWIVGCCLLTIVSIFLVHADIISYIRLLYSYGVGGYVQEASDIYMVSWQGFFSQLALFWSNTPILLLTLICSVVTFLFNFPKIPASLSSGLILIVLCAGHVHIHETILILPCLLFLFTGKFSYKNTSLLIVGWLVFFLSHFSPFFPYPFSFFPTIFLLILLHTTSTSHAKLLLP